MRRTARAAAATAAAAGIALGSAVLVPGVAAAATYGGQCGAGFTTGSRIDLAGGTVFLAGNGDLRCAITILNSTSSSGTSMSVWMRLSGTTSWDSDPGTYHQYAGPLHTSSFGCIDYGGRIGTLQNTYYTICW
jgi:hypothetical protein